MAASIAGADAHRAAGTPFPTHRGRLDTNLYSRQIGVFGIETMGKLVQMDVLIVGMRGLGVEIAKNVILAGPKSVTIFDPEPATLIDVGANYYLSPASVGKPRAAAVVDALAELNPYVHVSALSGAALEESTVARFHVVVFTHARRSELLRWNHFCRTRSPPIVFLAGDVRGAAGFAFSDFGPAHTVRDPNGEPTRVAIVTEATTDAPGGVTIFTHDGKRHGFDEGDFVVFKEIEGSIGSVLNDGVPRRIASVKANSFVLAAEGGGTEGLEYRGGGIAEGFKVPRTVVHCSLAERVASPCPTQGDGAGAMLTPDLGKFGRSEQLHAAWAGLEAFREAHGGELPALHDAAHADEVAEAARAWAASVTGGQAGAAPGLLAPADVDAAVARGLSLRARAELPGLAAFFGGVIAQEVVKATGKYTPLNQWLYLDAFEALPPPAPPAEFAAAGNRYDNAIALLGRTLQARVADARVFVVGAGALGCEFLKAYALMGVGTGPAGRVVVTDMDRIEVSNLNRQFLFRAWNVGSPKSVTAAAAAAAMNPDFRVEALEVPVGEDTEDTFDDAFWSGLDVVTNALDNLKARQYVDGRCVWYGLPLLESGTLGTKANTQVVVPHVTESYSDSVDPPEESIPMCTLRNFPHAIEHTIEWARDLFAGSFANTVQDAAAFVASPAAWLATAAEETNLHSRRTKLEGVRATLRAAEHADWPMCVRTARELFHAHFYTSIKQLLHNFPPDYADPATGIKFWSGPKRPPTAAIFDPADPVHAAFVVHAAALAAANYGVALPPGYDSPAVLGPINASIVLPDFVPKAVKIKASETDDTVEGADDDRDAVAALTAELSALAASGSVAGAPRLTAAEFEKDDDTNHHIDFVTAAANLRARNYRIKEASRLEVKMTAGKIIPAIATTTCAVTGLVTLEFLKVLQKQPIESLRNSFVNLAVNVYSMGEPGAPKRTKSIPFDPIACGPVKARPEGFTRWDKIVIPASAGVVTPAQLVAWFEREQGLGVNMVTSGRSILYNPMLFKRHREERANQPLVTLARAGAAALEAKSGAAASPAVAAPSNTAERVARNYLVLDVSCFDDDGDVLVPQLQLYLS